MSMRIIGPDEVQAMLGLDELVEPVGEALQLSSAGAAETGLIIMYPHADRTEGDVFVKTGVIAGAPIHVVKISPWFAANVHQGRRQGGFVAVLDSATGHSLFLVDDCHYVSDVRTAAAGALAARALAPPVVRVAGVIGAGVQAYWQAIALHRERPFGRLILWTRDRQRAERLAARIRESLPSVAIDHATDVESLVRASDVIVTATGSREPLVFADWLRPGQHITAVGADDPVKCELDAGVLRRATLFVDGLAEASENGDVRRAIDQGLYRRQDIAGELGAVLSGRIAGRTSAEQITIAKLVGLGAQDVAAAAVIGVASGILPATALPVRSWRQTPAAA
jgi:ornithine cyclodeaminase